MKKILITIMAVFALFASLKCTGQTNGNFKTLTADSLKPRQSSGLVLKNIDKVYVTSPVIDSTLRNWVKKIAAANGFDTTKLLKYIPFTDTLLAGKMMSKYFTNNALLSKVNYSDTFGSGKIKSKYQTDYLANFKNRIYYNEDTLLYIPDKINLQSNVFLSSGGGSSLSHTTSQTGWRNIGIGNGSLRKITSGYGNVCIGYLTGQYLTTGNLNVSIGSQFTLSQNTTGSSNVALGKGALGFNTTGSFNMSLGVDAGIYGNFNNSILIGVGAGKGSTGKGLNQTNLIKIGYMAGSLDTTNNRLFIENSSSQTPLIGGKFEVDQLGINAPITSTWSETLNVGGNITTIGSYGFKKVSASTPAITLSNSTAFGTSGLIDEDISGGSLHGININNNSSNNSINIVTSSDGDGIYINNNGTGDAINIRNAAANNAINIYSSIGTSQFVVNNLGKPLSTIDTTGTTANQLVTKNWVLSHMTGGGSGITNQSYGQNKGPVSLTTAYDTIFALTVPSTGVYQITVNLGFKYNNALMTANNSEVICKMGFKNSGYFTEKYLWSPLTPSASFNATFGYMSGWGQISNLTAGERVYVLGKISILPDSGTVDSEYGAIMNAVLLR